MGRVAILLSAALFTPLFAIPSTSFGRAWHGLNPGTSTKNEVIKKFGSPTRELPMTASYASALVYQAKEAQEYGADEAQFFFDNAGKLTSVFVFPAVEMKKDDVIKAFGTAFEERRTDDFRLYFQYKAEGFVVFFGKDNDTVYQLQYVPGTATAPAAGGTASSASTTKATK